MRCFCLGNGRRHWCFKKRGCKAGNVLTRSAAIPLRRVAAAPAVPAVSQAALLHPNVPLHGRPGPFARPRCSPPGAGAPNACSVALPPPNRLGGGGPTGEMPYGGLPPLLREPWCGTAKPMVGEAAAG